MPWRYVSPHKRIRIVSIDIGRENFAIYIEDTSLRKLLSLKEAYDNLSSRDKKRGDISTNMRRILRKLYKDSTSIHLAKIDIRADKVAGSDYDNASRLNLFAALNNLRSFIDKADIIVIEQQFFAQAVARPGGHGFVKRKGSQANIAAIKVGETTLSWFLMTYGETKDILTVPSTFKTTQLGAPKRMNKPERKKWTVAESLEIMKLRKDEKGILTFTKRGKKDDMADAVIQCQAFKLTYLIIPDT